MKQRLYDHLGEPYLVLQESEEINRNQHLLNLLQLRNNSQVPEQQCSPSQSGGNLNVHPVNTSNLPADTNRRNDPRFPVQDFSNILQQKIMTQAGLQRDPNSRSTPNNAIIQLLSELAKQNQPSSRAIQLQNINEVPVKHVSSNRVRYSTPPRAEGSNDYIARYNDAASRLLDLKSKMSIMHEDVIIEQALELCEDLLNDNLHLSLVTDRLKLKAAKEKGFEMNHEKRITALEMKMGERPPLKRNKPGRETDQ